MEPCYLSQPLTAVTLNMTLHFCLQAGASLNTVVISTTNQFQQTATVQHIGNGIYAVSATVEAEGCYQVLIQLDLNQDRPENDTPGPAVAPLQCQVVCKPAAAVAQCCKMELQAEPWVAGRADEVIVRQFDRREWLSGVHSQSHLPPSDKHNSQ